MTPRFSIDIDLTYLPINDRANSLAEIDEALDRLTQSIYRQLRGASAQKALCGGVADTRILVRQGGSWLRSNSRRLTGPSSMDPRAGKLPKPCRRSSGLPKFKWFLLRIFLPANFWSPSIGSTRATCST